MYEIELRAYRYRRSDHYCTHASTIERGLKSQAHARKRQKVALMSRLHRTIFVTDAQVGDTLEVRIVIVPREIVGPEPAVNLEGMAIVVPPHPGIIAQYEGGIEDIERERPLPKRHIDTPPKKKQLQLPAPSPDPSR